MRQLFAPLGLALLLTACGNGESLLPPNAVLPDGGRYRGEVVNGLLQGQGRIDYSNGSWYAGQFKDGQAEGSGEWQGTHGEHYQGQFHLGQFHGIGILERADGSRYEGAFTLGDMDGEGQLTRAGISYRGGFQANLYHGLGKLEWAEGQSYQGRFVRGQLDGEGLRSDGAGNRFSGTFTRGLLNGEGSFVGSDGDHYSGGFRNDRYHGKGRYEDAQGQVWLGRFKDGALHGEGEFIGADGSRYQGRFRAWRYHGLGELSMADGSRFKGHFAHGEYDGLGTLTLSDGSVQAGTWQNGRRIRDAQDQSLADPLEIGLLEQGQLLQQVIAALPASTPAMELYSLTLAGDGNQSVFLREADYVSRLLRERFAAYGNITLANHRDHLADRPVATRESLARSVRALAERSGKEDLIFIYLTSHGSSDHQLVLNQPRLELANLPAADLAALLQPLKDRLKVVVIAACYSGGFIPALKDEKTLVMTASRADRVSFGCSEESDFTYFGRALFGEALQETDDLAKAFEIAKTHVAEREEADGFEASEPQIWAPEAVLAHWRTLRATQPAAPPASANSAETAAGPAP
ncbi:MAG: C13 family peptidase [Pseudomonas sp.]|uniref:C13 family peptidase n=1 Tax=Pseudomonas sp. TaxID=306 RepID=UPI0033916A1A